MGRYVDAATAAEMKSERYNIDLADLVDVFAEIPSADVVEVRHGEWIYHDCVSSYDGAVSGYSCSECNIFVREEMFEGFEDFYKDYCGHCSAKMDGKRKDGADAD